MDTSTAGCSFILIKAKVTSTENLPIISLAHLLIISVKTNPFISPDN
nr:MAG TPA: hypothetical protein [Caudoviricetes sp.]